MKKPDLSGEARFGLLEHGANVADRWVSRVRADHAEVAHAIGTVIGGAVVLAVIVMLAALTPLLWAATSLSVRWDTVKTRRRRRRTVSALPWLTHAEREPVTPSPDEAAADEDDETEAEAEAAA